MDHSLQGVNWVGGENHLEGPSCGHWSEDSTLPISQPILEQKIQLRA